MSSTINNDSKHVWHPFTQHFTADTPVEIVNAEGLYLYDAEGQAYLDANSSWWVNTHGHAHPHIGEAISNQFNTIDHIVFAGVTHPKAVELATRTTGYLADHLTKVFFSDNGSTAVEIAMKMAIQYWSNMGAPKHRFLAINGSYHGDTFGAMSVGQRGYFNTPFEALFFDANYIDFPTVENAQEQLDKAERLFKSGEFAAMIVEPLVQGAAGMRMYSAEFLDKLSALATQYDVLIIFDEVMTGYGRTGKMFAQDYCQIKPDLVALSKGLTAGVMALGLTVASESIYEAFLSKETSKALLHGHSFTANPIACAVACANLDIFEESGTWDAIDAICSWNSEFATELETFSNVSNIRQQGTILAFEVGGGDASYFSDIKSKAYTHFMNDGILIRPLGNVIFINPPYIISKEEYSQLKSSILKFLLELN